MYVSPVPYVGEVYSDTRTLFLAHVFSVIRLKLYQPYKLKEMVVFPLNVHKWHNIHWLV